MRFDRVLLVKPMYHGSHYEDPFLPAGLGYISEALSGAGIPNKVVDLEFGYSLDDLAKQVDEFEAKLIGISLMSYRYERNLRMIKSIKERFPSIPIAVGGPHLSTLRAKTLEECFAIDLGVTLEGEETIVELCKGKAPWHEVKGLLYRENGEINYTGDRSFIQDLDSVRFPTYSNFELEKYPPFINVVTSRGCPFACVYCPAPLAIGRRFRIRSASSVADELEYWYHRGYRHLGIADDNFTLQMDRVWAICDEIEKRKLNGLRIDCGNGIRADRVNRDLLKRMKEVGFEYIAFGVEGGNDKVLKALRKGEKIEVIERAVRDACDLGFRVTLFFLLGSPGETREDVMDSVRFALRHPVYDVRFYNIIPFPNTDLYRWISENQYFIRGVDYLNDASHWVNDPVYETPELNREQRREMYEWANKVVEKHTFPVKRKFHENSTAVEFARLGMPGWMANACSHLYWTYAINELVRRAAASTGVRDRLRALRR